MRYVVGFLSAVALMALVGLGVVRLGAYNVAASNPHFGLVRWALNTTMHNAVERRAQEIRAPGEFSDQQVRQGLRHYQAMCVHCHGAPGVERALWAVGMRPLPPYLWLHTHWSPAEVFWIVKHGIKMSGMPAFEGRLQDQQIWEVAAFIDRLPSIDPEQYRTLQQDFQRQQ